MPVPGGDLRDRARRWAVGGLGQAAGRRRRWRSRSGTAPGRPAAGARSRPPRAAASSSTRRFSATLPGRPGLWSRAVRNDAWDPSARRVRVDALTVRSAGDPGQGATVAADGRFVARSRGYAVIRCALPLRDRPVATPSLRSTGSRRSAPGRPPRAPMPGGAHPACEPLGCGGRSRHGAPAPSCAPARAARRCPASASVARVPGHLQGDRRQFQRNRRVRKPQPADGRAAVRALARPTASVSRTIISEAAKVGTVAITVRRSPRAASAVSRGPVNRPRREKLRCEASAKRRTVSFPVVSGCPSRTTATCGRRTAPPCGSPAPGCRSHRARGPRSRRAAAAHRGWLSPRKRSTTCGASSAARASSRGPRAVTKRSLA